MAWPVTDGSTGDPGSRQHNFPPHLALDGTEFTDWESSTLSVGESSAWIAVTGYFPGDHKGCQCQTVPIVCGALVAAAINETAAGISCPIPPPSTEALKPEEPFSKATANRQMKAWAENLNAERAAAMKNWVTMDGYQEVRDAELRGLTRGAKAKAARLMEDTLKDAPKWRTKMYRGMRFNSQEGTDFLTAIQREGGFETRALSSWSQDQAIAKRFGIWDDVADLVDDGGYSIVIEAESKTARMGSQYFREALAGIDDEKEVISMVNTKYRYVSHTVQNVKDQWGDVIAHRVKLIVEEI